jgi:predicted phosphodiesterase
MKIYLASDLHNEMDDYLTLPAIAADCVVLAGDIHRGGKLFDVAAKFREHFHAPVICVAGNHEYYQRNYVEQLAEFRCDAEKLRNIFFLENNRLYIDNVRFLGCTLWSSFSLYGDDRIKEAKSVSLNSINDFHVIRYDNRIFSPDDAAELHAMSYLWLERELAQPFDGKTVVVTHFAPHRAAIHAKHSATGGDHLTPYFVSDCSRLMREYRIDAWLYGHTHNSTDAIVDGGTRLVSNQRGYPSESSLYTRFDSEKIIEI